MCTVYYPWMQVARPFCYKSLIIGKRLRVVDYAKNSIISKEIVFNIFCQWKKNKEGSFTFCLTIFNRRAAETMPAFLHCLMLFIIKLDYIMYKTVTARQPVLNLIFPSPSIRVLAFLFLVAHVGQLIFMFYLVISKIKLTTGNIKILTKAGQCII